MSKSPTLTQIPPVVGIDLGVDGDFTVEVHGQIVGGKLTIKSTTSTFISESMKRAAKEGKK